MSEQRITNIYFTFTDGSLFDHHSSGREYNDLFNNISENGIITSNHHTSQQFHEMLAIRSQSGNLAASGTGSQMQMETKPIVNSPKRAVRFPSSVEGLVLPSYLKAVTSSPDWIGEPSGDPQPELKPPNSSVSTRAGQTASLTCFVRSLGNKQVNMSQLEC